MTLGSTIKEHREKCNLTQEYMAERLGIKQSTYSKLERDEIDPTYSKLVKIAQVLNVSLSKIINVDGNLNVLNNQIENSPISYNATNNYSIDPKLEKLYESKIKLLEEKTESIVEENTKLKQENDRLKAMIK